MPKTPPGLTLAGIAFALAAFAAGSLLEHTAAASTPEVDVEAQEARIAPAGPVVPAVPVAPAPSVGARADSGVFCTVLLEA